MNNKCCLGIDPGSKGFMAYQFNGVYKKYYCTE